MRVIDKRPSVSRRTFLRTSTAASAGIVALSVSGGTLMGAKGAWALDVKNLKPETMQTLVQMARDTYPHDRFSDAIYVKAVGGYDDQAGSDAVLKALLEDGVTTLDGMANGAHGGRYVDVGWEIDRVALLRSISDGAFFQKIRGDLVVSIYNQPEVWQRLGYEGESASKGGYINRGFDDIDWI